MGGPPTDNFAKNIYLTSQIDEDDFEIDGYSIKRCDHPDDKPRGGIAVYYKSDLPIIFKPELTKFPESFTFQVKFGNKKNAFLHAFIKIHLLKIILLKKLMNFLPN